MIHVFFHGSENISLLYQELPWHRWDNIHQVGSPNFQALTIDLGNTSFQYTESGAKSNQPEIPEMRVMSLTFVSKWTLRWHVAKQKRTDQRDDTEPSKT